MLSNPGKQQITYACIAYGALSVLCLAFLQNFAYGPIQIRISEALCIVALFSRKAPLTLGISCAAANIIAMLVFSTYPLGLLDVVCGGAATFLGALWCYYYRDRSIAFALFGFVLFNAFVIPAYLPILITDTNLYTIPFTDISVYGNLLFMYIFGAICVAIGEGLVIYVLGLPFAKFLAKKYDPKEN